MAGAGAFFTERPEEPALGETRMSPITNRQDLDFLLYDLLGTEALFERPRFAAYDRASVTAVLDTAQKLAEEYYLPIAGEMDRAEPRFENGTAITHPKLKQALAAYSEAGFLAAGFDEAEGGLQMPATLHTALNGFFFCANVSAQNYALLTVGVANLLSTFGSEPQKQLFMPPLLEGRWFGTMCLSEPQAGSSLADIRTKAEPRGDGSFNLTGSKMWISGGEQDLTENIIHMVLAKLPDAPPGVKGISLFIVPKIRVGADGTLGERNNITLMGLNHKLGNRGTTNTLLAFGDEGETVGYLVGEPHKGLSYMFQMMNEARIGVGQGAAMIGLAGYLYSLAYARERPQGRPLTNRDPSTPPVPIIQHADVKRLLMAQKAAVEGAMALVFYCAQLVDLIETTTDDHERAELQARLDLLTPIAKSWPSENCLEANKHAIQVLGGYGYTVDYPVERFYRDNRLNHIHEGTHAIHGLDLLGRKVPAEGGRAMRGLVGAMKETIAATLDDKTLSPLSKALDRAVDHLVRCSVTIAQEPNPEKGLANATPYLDGFGHVVVAWLWLRQAVAAQEAAAEGRYGPAFLEGKQRAARYFFEYELPLAVERLRLAASLTDVCLTAEPEHFVGS